MAVTKARKAEQIEKLSNDLKGVNNVVVGTFTKLTVMQDFELRKAVRSAGGRYSVVKNTLVERATKGTSLEQAFQNLAGVTSVAYTTGDPVALAKAIAKYLEDNKEQFQIKGGMIEGRAAGPKEVAQLATMPSREQVMAKLLFLISAPAQRLVTVMNAVGRDLAVVVNQGVAKKKFKEA
jgi:large subunit ribosomal protein L10